MSNLSLNSSHLSGLLLTDSRARFDEWKRQLVFQYDFVKGLLQENDLYRSEMDRMEVQLRDIQSLQAKEIGDLGSQLPTGHCNSISNPFSSVTKSSGQESPSQQTTAVVLIDGNTFVIVSSLLSQGYAGGCLAARKLLAKLDFILASEESEGGIIDYSVHVYVSLERLEQSLGREHHRKTELISHFVRGFNSVSGTMNLIEIGDEEGLTYKKLKEHLEFVVKSSSWNFLILGVENPFEYGDCFEWISKHGYQKVYFLSATGESSNPQDLREMNLNIPFCQIRIDEIFADKATTIQPKHSYVYIVQKNVSEASSQSPLTTTIGVRKVSNTSASSISTIAEDDPALQGSLSKKKPSNKLSPNDDLTSLDSAFSELACTTAERKLRIENRKKDIQSKWQDNGLLAIVPCPKEEPDRRMLSFIRNLPEKPCNKYYLSQCLFPTCQYSHEYEFTDKQLSAMAWIVKSSPCPEWETCKNGEKCIYGHICRWNENGVCRKYGTGCRFPPGGHPKTD